MENYTDALEDTFDLNLTDIAFISDVAAVSLFPVTLDVSFSTLARQPTHGFNSYGLCDSDLMDSACVGQWQSRDFTLSATMDPRAVTDDRWSLRVLSSWWWLLLAAFVLLLLLLLLGLHMYRSLKSETPERKAEAEFIAMMTQNSQMNPIGRFDIERSSTDSDLYLSVCPDGE
jgi:hypothetical protein